MPTKLVKKRILVIPKQELRSDAAVVPLSSPPSSSSSSSSSSSTTTSSASSLEDSTCPTALSTPPLLPLTTDSSPAIATVSYISRRSVPTTSRPSTSSPSFSSLFSSPTPFILPSPLPLLLDSGLKLKGMSSVTAAPTSKNRNNTIRVQEDTDTGLAVTPNKRKRKISNNSPWSETSHGTGMMDVPHLIDLTESYKDTSHSPPSSNPTKLKSVKSASPRVTEKSKLPDTASVEKLKEKGNNIANLREAILGEGGDKDGGKYVGNVVGRGRSEKGRHRAAAFSTVDNADVHGLTPEERGDSALVGSTAAPDCSQAVISTSLSASGSRPDSVPVLVLAPVLNLGESLTDRNQKDGVFATTDVMIHHADVENISEHASKVVGDIDDGNDDDSDDDLDNESGHNSTRILNLIHQQDRKDYPHRFFAPSIEDPVKRRKYTKKSRNGGPSNYPAPALAPALAITSPSTFSDRSSLNVTESHITKEKKQLTAQLSFMIARQR